MHSVYKTTIFGRSPAEAASRATDTLELYFRLVLRPVPRIGL